MVSTAFNVADEVMRSKDSVKGFQQPAPDQKITQKIAGDQANAAAGNSIEVPTKGNNEESKGVNKPPALPSPEIRK